MAAADERSSGISPSQQALAVIMCLAGQLIYAVQFVAEEFLLKRQCYLSPRLLIGWEGLWGVLLFVGLAPLLTVSPAGFAHGLLHEDFVDTLRELAASPTAIALSVTDLFLFYVGNIPGILLTLYGSATTNQLVRSFIPGAIWCVSLTLFYCGSRGVLAEAWTTRSWIKLGGYAVLTVGTICYSRDSCTEYHRCRHRPSASPSSTSREPASAEDAQAACDVDVRGV